MTLLHCAWISVHFQRLFKDAFASCEVKRFWLSWLLVSSFIPTQVLLTFDLSSSLTHLDFWVNGLIVGCFLDHQSVFRSEKEVFPWDTSVCLCWEWNTCRARKCKQFNLFSQCFVLLKVVEDADQKHFPQTHTFISSHTHTHTQENSNCDTKPDNYSIQFS